MKENLRGQCFKIGYKNIPPIRCASCRNNHQYLNRNEVYTLERRKK